jgi:hypothetical protein
MMLSSSPQLPDGKFPELQSTTGAPPWTGIFLSLPSPKKAIHWPSGEKKGEVGFSVPGSGVKDESQPIEAWCYEVILPYAPAEKISFWAKSWETGFADCGLPRRFCCEIPFRSTGERIWPKRTAPLRRFAAVRRGVLKNSSGTLCLADVLECCEGTDQCLL